MSDTHVPGRTIARLDNAKALRAYAHPVRMKLIVALRTRGPLTATQAGRLLGESSGTCSFHLRQLAKYGLVEETGDGVGREKPWRATATSTDWDDCRRIRRPRRQPASSPRCSPSRTSGSSSAGWNSGGGESEEWQRAAFIGDDFLWVTADELTQIEHDLDAVTNKYFERQVKPELRPPGARLVTSLRIAFPNVTLPEEQ